MILPLVGSPFQPNIVRDVLTDAELVQEMSTLPDVHQRHFAHSRPNELVDDNGIGECKQAVRSLSG